MKRSLLQRPETAVDVFKLLPEGVHCQVIKNKIYMSPAPSIEHQIIISNIQFEIMSLLKEKKRGICVSGPVDVFLDKYNAYQPDLVFISAQNISVIGKDGKIHGAPDLVVEVLSPGNANDDKVRKKTVYEKCGVKEYFIVQPTDKSVISYYYKEGKFEKGKPQKAKITSRLLKKTFRF